jgi:hypothetical protein
LYTRRVERREVTEQTNTREKSLFLAEIERLMDVKGIEDLEELHERFLEQEPERIGNARWTFERFRKHASHEAGMFSEKFVVPLAGALEATTEEERDGLIRAWFADVWGPAPEA